MLTPLTEIGKWRPENWGTSFAHIFTVRQRSCGKVMFLVVSVCLFRGEVPVQTPGQPNPTLPSYRILAWGPPPPANLFNLGLNCTGSHAPRHVQTCSLWSMDCRQAGSWHSTGMPSCSILRSNAHRGWTLIVHETGLINREFMCRFQQYLSYVQVALSNRYTITWIYSRLVTKKTRKHSSRARTARFSGSVHRQTLPFGGRAPPPLDTDPHTHEQNDRHV